MIFEQKGNTSNPKILLIHAMYCDSSIFDNLVQCLVDKYCIITPTLDGHAGDGSVFSSAQGEADKILTYLKKNNIEQLEMLMGVSLGGIIAFEIFRRKQIEIKHVFLDGTPFIRLSSARRKFMEFIFKKVVKDVKKHPEKKGILDKKYPHSAKIMKQVCMQITDESICHLVKACYTYELPETIELDHSTLMFLYGSEEKAALCIPSLKKYTNTSLLIKEGYSHCQFLGEFPKAYADLLFSATCIHKQ